MKNIKETIQNKVIKKRVKWIDLARALAIVVVVLCHAVENTYVLDMKHVQTLPLWSQIFAFAGFSIGRIGVPFFLMISGYLLLDRDYDSVKIKKFWKKSWLHFLLCTVIWFAIYDLIIIVATRQSWLNFWTVLEDLLLWHHVNMWHVWYMPMVLGLYMVIPFIAIALRKIDDKLLIFPVIFFTFFSFVFHLADVINNVVRPGVPLDNQLAMGFGGSAYWLYLIFGYMVKKGMFKKIKTSTLWMASLISLALCVWLQVWSYGHHVQYNLWYDCLPLAVASLSLFELLSRLKNVRGYRLAKIISYYSFPIYLIHFVVLLGIKPLVNGLAVAMPVKVLIMWTVIFAVAFVLSVVINHIPKVGKFLLYTK